VQREKGTLNGQGSRRSTFEARSPKAVIIIFKKPKHIAMRVAQRSGIQSTRRWKEKGLRSDGGGGECPATRRHFQSEGKGEQLPQKHTGGYVLPPSLSSFSDFPFSLSISPFRTLLEIEDTSSVRLCLTQNVSRAMKVANRVLLFYNYYHYRYGLCRSDPETVKKKKERETRREHTNTKDEHQNYNKLTLKEKKRQHPFEFTPLQEGRHCAGNNTGNTYITGSDSMIIAQRAKRSNKEKKRKER
jgi:hypothetical protein